MIIANGENRKLVEKLSKMAGEVKEQKSALLQQRWWTKFQDFSFSKFSNIQLFRIIVACLGHFYAYIYIYAYHYTIVYGVLQAVVPHEIFQLLKTINQVSVPLN